LSKQHKIQEYLQQRKQVERFPMDNQSQIGSLLDSTIQHSVSKTQESMTLVAEAKRPQPKPGATPFLRAKETAQIRAPTLQRGDHSTQEHRRILDFIVRGSKTQRMKSAGKASQANSQPDLNLNTHLQPKPTVKPQIKLAASTGLHQRQSSTESNDEQVTGQYPQVQSMSIGGKASQLHEKGGEGTSQFQSMDLKQD